jgi:hypothetical protein
MESPAAEQREVGRDERRDSLRSLLIATRRDNDIDAGCSISFANLFAQTAHSP